MGDRFHSEADGKQAARMVWEGERAMLRVLGWAVLIIFLIGLLVVFGIFDLIF